MNFRFHKVWEVNKEGDYGALVMRYAECSLRCHVCYAQEYAYLNPQKFSLRTYEEVSNELSKKIERVGWTRIQGGEPLLDKHRALATADFAIEALNYMSSGHSPYSSPRTIIQTNGIWIGNAPVSDINEFVKKLVHRIKEYKRGRIVIEISFKGANEQDSGLYALSSDSPYVSNRATKGILSIQAEGFRKLVDVFEKSAWSQGVDRVAIYPVAGLGPELDRPGFTPVSTILEDYPLFHPKTWDKTFEQTVKEFRSLLNKEGDVYKEYEEKHGYKLPMESINASKYQLGWIKQLRIRGELQDFTKRYLRADWSNAQLNFFRSWFKKQSGKELSDMIPQASSQLLSRISDLTSDFYDSKPINHYPYL